jgi:hypothetical protein
VPAELEVPVLVAGGGLWAAYNAGASRVPRQGPLVALPLETRAYVSRVMSRM